MSKNKFANGYPLTKTEYGIYADCTSSPKSTAYNLPVLWKLDKSTNILKLKSAVEKAVECHPYIKTQLMIDENGNVLKQQSNAEAKVEICKISTAEPDRSTLVKPFELLQSQLYTIKIFDAPDAVFLFYDVHHIIFDGTSHTIFQRDIDRLYRGEAVEAEAFTGNDVSVEEIEKTNSLLMQSAKEYYAEVFGAVEAESVPYNDKKDGTPKAEKLHFDFTKFNADDIRSFSRQHGIKTSTFFNGVFGCLIAKYSYDDESLFATVFNGRDSRLANTCGMFVKTMPVYCNTAQTDSIAEYLKNIDKQIDESRKNDIYSYADVCGDLKINPKVLFAYQGDYMQKSVFCGKEVVGEMLTSSDAKENITIEIERMNGKFFAILEYRADLYFEQSMQIMLDAFEKTVCEFLTKDKLSQVDVSSDNQLKLLDSFNNTQVDFDRSKSIVDLFREQVAKTPDNTAVVYLNKKYTYKEADEISERIAGYLKSKGIGKEDVVSVLIPRCEYMALASIGILKSGAGYQPLDPSYPVERLEFMIKDADVKLLIADESLVNIVESYKGEVLLTKDIPTLPQCEKMSTNPAPEDLFIMLYTSGSTGVPKGCMLEHRNLVAFCNWFHNYYKLTANSNVAAYASYGFDADMMDLYPALTCGAAVHIIDESIRLDLLALNDYYEQNSITHNFITTQVGRQFAAEIDNHSLVELSVGGEKLVPVNPPQNYKFYNIYGPTECTICISGFCVDKLYDRVPIGKALDNTKFYILDKHGKRLPVGVPGELCVAGYGVSRGYLNRPEQNKKAFTPNPFCSQDGYNRIYHTGDIVRYLSDGNVDFVGRRDGQVKIRGFRIELSEVESIIREFDGIKDATVAAFDEAGGGKFIAAYIVSDHKINIAKLNEFIAENKPPYMVPAVTMQIDKIPLNQNQKVNKKALPVPVKEVEETVPPQNETQQKIFDCIADVIGTDNFGITTDIFYAGLTSISSIKLNVLLSKAFDAVIKTKDLKDNNTVEKLEKFLSNAQAVTTYDILTDYPITQTQNGIFVESASNQDSTMYNIPYLFKLDKNVNTDKLKAAVETVINAHPYIKTILKLNEQGDIRALRNDDAKPVVEVVKTAVLPQPSQLVTPYSITDSRLYNAKIYITDDGSYFLLDLHHIICDGTSDNVLIADINKAYDGQKVEKEQYTGFEIALDEQKARQSDAYAKAKDYYDSIFDGCDTDFLPPKDITDKEQSVSTYECKCDVSLDKIKDFCNKTNVTLNAFFNGLFGFVLGKYNYNDEAVFTTVYNGRNDSRLANSVTMLVKTMPVYCKVDGERKIKDLLTETAEQLMNSMSNDIYSFAEISNAYGINADILFAYQGDSFKIDKFCGETADAQILELNSAKAPITIFVFIKDGKFVFDCEYRSDMYNENTISGMLDCICTAAEDFATKTYLKDVNITNSNALETVESFNNTEVEYDRSKSIVDLFREQVAKTPDNTAVVYLDKKYTYKEADEITERIAGYLKSKGIGKEDVVSVLIPRCEYMALASIGILKSGAGYQPLDPSYPVERLEFMIKDADAKLLIADESLVNIVESYKGEVLLTKDIPALPECEKMSTNPAPEDLFIMLYTSGSTGVPKGCMLEHRNLVAFCHWFHSYYNLSDKSKVAAYASYGFDADMMDLYPALTCGAAVHIIDESIRLDLLALNDYFESNGISHSFITTQVGRQFAAEIDNHSLVELSVGGEKLVPVNPPKNFSLYNLYGPTECTICITDFLVDKLYDRVPIGKSLDNTKLYIVDKYGKRLPVGVPGELCVAGYRVSRGYLNRPEQNAKAFTPNPFCNKDGYDRIYHTGDIVRYLPDGNIDFVGRRDGQVKIRGFRIELSEVESIIREFDGIKDATVAAFDEAGGGKFIAAYIVSDSKIDIAKLNEFIAENKPPYMVPAVTMQIDKIPLNQNQKVNKKALPVPVKEVEETIPPQNETQQKIFDCIADVIGTQNFGITTDIYLAGLTSIGAIRLNVLLSKAFDTVIKTKDLKENNTVEKLEKFLSNAEEITAYDILPDYPITQTQNGIFVECAANPGSTMYNIPFFFKLDNKVDTNKLKTAVETAINAHPYIKTTLELTDNGDIRALRNDSLKPVVEIIKTSFIPEQAELVTPYKILGDTLYRAKIFITDSGNYLLLDLHHIICDGTSEAVLIADINKAYDGQNIEAESYTGFEAALDEEKLLKSDTYQKAKEYYDSVFNGCDTDFLPPKDKDTGIPSAKTFEVECDASVDAVKTFCNANGITLNAFFNGLFGFVLGKYNYKDEAVFTTIYNGRSDSRLANSVTMLVKTLPVYCNVDGERKIKDLLTDTGSQLMSSMTNDIYSFAEISRAYNLKADIMFVYQGDSFQFDNIGGEKAEVIPLELNVAKAPISIDVFIKNGKFVFYCEYRSDIYEESTLLGITDCLCTAAKEFTSKTLLKEVSITSDKAMAVLEAFNATEVEVENTTCNKMFEKQAELNADKTAVIANGESLTYKQLNENANKIANSLVANGVKPDDMVGVMMPRTVYAYAVREGILKAGGAFMPLDPKYPDDRIAYILSDSHSKLTVTTEELAEKRKDLFASAGVTVLTVESLLKNTNTENPQTDVNPENLCYCIYTSGSTGKPKGVMIEHHSLVNFVHYDKFNQQAQEFCENMSVTLALAALTFDVSVLEETMPLYHGATVAMATEDEINNPVLLAQMMLDNKVDVMKCTPSYMNNMLDIPIVQKALANMKAIDIGAEAFPAPLYNKMRKAGVTAKIYNGYGPTEATVTTSIDYLESSHITIGKPLCNTKVYMLDKNKNILPVGVPGELTILGSCVGRGYVGNKELTKDKFITFNGLPAYRSGDLARWSKDGKIDFMGRMDNQVKLRGLRVELDEIENVMNDYPSVLRSVVLVKENEQAGQFLCGYFTGSESVDKDRLTEHMKRYLTHYMIPSVLVQLDSFPLTNNGKVDKRALPEPEFTVTERNYTAPVTELQKRLCTMFEKALGLDKVGIDEDFFEIGGTSLSASKIAMRAMTENLPIAYGDIFDNPTVQKLEKHVLMQQGKTTHTEEKSEDEYAAVGADKALAHNKTEFVDEVKYTNTGNVLLTGATGFLGIHVLKQIIEHTENSVYCLIRKGRSSKVENRLKGMLMYYFDSTMENLFNKRIFVIEGDITDKNIVNGLSQYNFNTVINCAACVKHFTADDTLDRINVHGVENLIEMCVATGRRLVQVSTVSVAGENINKKFSADKKMHENELYFGQDLTNKYINTKFRAEKAVLEAVADKELDGKIIRVGNLMSRHSDGEFQINSVTSGFMRMLRGYAVIGKFPVSAMDGIIEFSPIDYTACAIMCLAGTNKDFTVYQACNGHKVQMGDIIEAINNYGIKIDVVSDADFKQAMLDTMQDDKKNMLISGLISYLSSDSETTTEYIDYDNSFTTKALYRLGFKWPITDEKYLSNAIKALDTLGYFDGRFD